MFSLSETTALIYFNIENIFIADDNANDGTIVTASRRRHLNLHSEAEKQSPYRCSTKFTGEHLCNFSKRETLAQVFPSEFCEISMNNFSYRTPPVTTSETISFMCLTFRAHSSVWNLWKYAVNFAVLVCRAGANS